MSSGKSPPHPSLLAARWHQSSSGVRTDPWEWTLGQSTGVLACPNSPAGRGCTTELKLLISFFFKLITCFLFCPYTKQACYSDGFSFSFKDFLALHLAAGAAPCATRPDSDGRSVLGPRCQDIEPSSTGAEASSPTVVCSCK